MVIFYKKWKKYNEIQLTKNKVDLNIQKMTNHPLSPVPKYNNNKQNMIFYDKWKKYNEIQLTKRKIDLNIQQMTNHPRSILPSDQTI